MIEAGPGGFPAEQAIALAPDLVILDRAQAGATGPDGGNPLLRTRAAAGLPVAVIDLHGHPLRDTAPVMCLLGREHGRGQARRRRRCGAAASIPDLKSGRTISVSKQA